ncbi:hypothetical protein [Demequina soli]|uniref:hypothetical protein n=1 Tax=Demequina soli TaxID=1638987 RepID=UPI00078094A2|nr:hypothetical protein [Demequina soli]
MTEPIWSAGGAGGTVAVVEDLEAAVGALVDAAGELERAARLLGVASRTVAWDPRAGPAAAGLLDAAAASSREADGMRALATALLGTARAYLEAEAAARAPVIDARGVLEGVADWFGTVAWAYGAAARARLAALPGAGRLAGTPLGLDAIGLPPTTALARRDTAQGLLSGPGFDAGARALARAVALAEAAEPRYRTVEAVGTAGDRAPDSVADVMRRLAWLESLGDGSVAIETVRDGTGTRHLVYVPGTEDWGITDANTADAQADLAAVTGGWPDAARAVVDAMAAEGIGPDDPVLIAGHSQGGIIATVVAAALAGRYRVTQVVTAGAPTGRLALPASVGALHLENTRDLVPGLDGRANPATPTRVTVSHDRRRSTRPDSPDGSRTVAQAHGIRGYEATARLVDEGVSDSTRAWVDGARPMLAGGAGTVTTYRPVTGAG